MIFETGILPKNEAWEKRSYGTFWPDLGFEHVLRDFFPRVPSGGRRLLSIGSPPEPGFVPREAAAFEIFRRGSLPVRTHPSESSTLGRRMRRSYVFEILN